MPGTPASYGYLGPVGTFTHQALLTLVGDERAELAPYATVGQALQAVRDGVVGSALVPIENSVEGGVSATLDNLTYGDPLVIVREVLLPVQFGLYARPGTTLGEVRVVLTHPHAAAQCREWLAAHLPAAQVVERGSTAGAAAEVAQPGSSVDAAVCAQVAGELYGLEALASAIADNADAVTRFVLVARPGPVGAPTGADKTSVVLFMRDNHPGALLQILEQFASRGVDLSRIESRPTRRTLGDYCFAIDAEGHVSDARLAEAMMGLYRTCAEVVFLGSYPRADRTAVDVRPGTANADYDAAATWLERLKGRAVPT
ncbi:prephenate dehydratase [Microlunatus sagamiharensis]|uniref:Prephenate dehydratase n=1 Tax=Microlunatus sagamiharensis TaxID=546874 RepID=A0A1H2NB06_9ACTN|nr:prephenate dehydratase [Microlunatus sagamiharensis]SDV02564.1 prephenate dehydratase [Microlunatus sagamiharensis]